MSAVLEADCVHALRALVDWVFGLYNGRPSAYLTPDSYLDLNHYVRCVCECCGSGDHARALNYRVGSDQLAGNILKLHNRYIDWELSRNLFG